MSQSSLTHSDKVGYTDAHCGTVHPGRRVPLLGCRTVKSTRAPVQQAGLSGKLPEVFRWESQEQIHSQTHVCVWWILERCRKVWTVVASEVRGTLT